MDERPAAPPGNPFWDHAVALYGRPGVAPACLELQDRLGLDVNLVLLCVWAAAEGPGALSTEELARLDAIVSAWRGAAVEPLRALRRRLKAGVPGIPAEKSAALRRGVQALELDAERTEQDVLHTALAGRPRGGATAPDVTARANLDSLARLHGCRPAAAAAAFDAILAAAFPAGSVNPGA